MSTSAPGRLLEELRSALDRLTRPPLVTAAAAGIFVLLFGIVLRHLWGLEPPSGGEIETGTGDFLAFWTGAVTLHEGRATELYSYSAQQALQARLLGGAPTGFQPYLNPPLLAVLLEPLVPLGYVRAFYVYDLASALLLLLGLFALLRLLPVVRSAGGGLLATVFLVAGYQPMLQTTLGGQNTAITFALLCALALALRGSSAVPAAVALGLLTYKPQYAIGAGLALAMAGRWTVLVGSGLLALLHYALGAWKIGALWPLAMLEFMKDYRPHEIAENADTHFSWVRTADFLLPSPFDTAAAAVGVFLVLALWWRHRDLGKQATGPWVALVVTGTMLISPHQQYYDAALLTLPAALLVEHRLRRTGGLPLAIRVALAAAWVGYPAWRWGAELHVQPLFLLLLGLATWAVRECSADPPNQAAERSP